MDPRYDEGMKLGGVIYMYDISAKRLTGSTHLNLKMLEKLCGSKAFDKVIIGTTKWSSRGDDHAAQYRLEELKRDYWDVLIRKGATVQRIGNDQESGKAVVRALLETPSNQRQESNFKIALKIQQELVDEEKLVPRTEAGKTLNFSMKDLLKAKKQELAETKSPEERGRIQGEIVWLKGQIDDLSTGFFQRLKWWIT
jgi:hypothetical protein